MTVVATACQSNRNQLTLGRLNSIASRLFNFVFAFAFEQHWLCAVYLCLRGLKSLSETDFVPLHGDGDDDELVYWQYVASPVDPFFDI